MHIRLNSCRSFNFHTIRRFLATADNTLISSHDSISPESSNSYLNICNIASLYNKHLTPLQLIETSKEYSKNSNAKIDLDLYNKLTGLTRQSDRVEIADLLILLQSLSNENIRNYEDFSFCSEVIKRKLNKMYNRRFAKDEVQKYKPNKDLLLSIFYVFSNCRILHFPLFDIISKLYTPFVEDSNFSELDVVIRALAIHGHRNQLLLDEIKLKLIKANDINSQIATSFFYNYALLSYVDEPLLSALENQIYKIGNHFKNNKMKKREDLINEIVNAKIGIDHYNAGLLLYTYLLLKLIDYKLIIKLLDLQRDFLERIPQIVDEISARDLNHANRLYFIRSEFYAQLPTELRIILRNLSLVNSKNIQAKERVFQQKVSWHLTKMRIAHSLSVMRSGLNMDIVEHDKRVVWQCNSYHRFYQNSFTLTAKVQLEQELIKALGYSIVNIQYYQWNRMMIKDTRFAYLRMARYYALQDSRELDSALMGWNLPYLWKNSKKSRIMADVSYSYKYQPLSHSPYNS